jgi:hypothetical protein
MFVLKPVVHRFVQPLDVMLAYVVQQQVKLTIGNCGTIELQKSEYEKFI